MSWSDPPLPGTGFGGRPRLGSLDLLPPPPPHPLPALVLSPLERPLSPLKRHGPLPLSDLQPPPKQRRLTPPIGLGSGFVRRLSHSHSLDSGSDSERSASEGGSHSHSHSLSQSSSGVVHRRTASGSKRQPVSAALLPRKKYHRPTLSYPLDPERALTSPHSALTLHNRDRDRDRERERGSLSMSEEDWASADMLIQEGLSEGRSASSASPPPSPWPSRELHALPEEEVAMDLEERAQEEQSERMEVEVPEVLVHPPPPSHQEEEEEEQGEEEGEEEEEGETALVRRPRSPLGMVGARSPHPSRSPFLKMVATPPPGAPLAPPVRASPLPPELRATSSPEPGRAHPQSSLRGPWRPWRKLEGVPGVPLPPASPRSVPLNAATVHLLDTYRAVMGAQQAAQQRAQEAKVRRQSLYYPVHPGEVLGGRYQVLELLGKGSFGQVVKAQGEGEAPVAIKIIRKSAPFLAQGRREVAVLQLLRAHADPLRNFIVRLDEEFLHQGHLCLVFELLSVHPPPPPFFPFKHMNPK